MNKHGGKREGAGRKPKKDEQAIVDMLAPLEGKWLQALERGLEQTQGWAAKLYADYYIGKPKERLEVTSEEGIKNITFTVVKTNQDEIQD
jgi:hypothetical protein